MRLTNDDYVLGGRARHKKAGSMATKQNDLHAAIFKLLDLYLDATDGGPWPHHPIYGEEGWKREGEAERHKTERKRYEMRSQVTT